MIRKLTRKLGERGQIILMVGLATIVMFGIVGLAVDVGRLYVTRVELGRSLDAAALSGILELNGQQSGLDNAEDKAEAYFTDNEEVSSCDGSEGVTCVVTADPDANELTMDGTKTIKMVFLSVLGIKSASVSAHAKAGFGTQFLDAVLVLDATPSMAGNPITQAKAASNTFKDILLGNSPTGNVLVGVTAFRGCYDPTLENDCVNKNNWAQNLTFNKTTLQTKIGNILGGGGDVGTNVCTGLAQGWNIISDPSNHDDDVLYPGNRQYLILLSDGDNYYPGDNTRRGPYDTTAPLNTSSSPEGTVVSGQAYPCQTYETECSSPWAGGSCTTSLNGSTGAPDGNDGSNPTTCVNQDPTRRERQLDVRTLNLARAIKNQGVEIFVVAFSGGVPGCDLGNTTVFDDEDTADCNTVKDSPSGPVGNGLDDDDGANHRLLKCIASNTQGRNDHYFYASDEDELNGIFTAIANQIAHRLIE